MSKKIKKPSRRRARRLALQALYQWQLTQNEPRQIIADMAAEKDPTQIDLEYFDNLVEGAIAHSAEIDKKLTEKLDRALEDLDPVELSVLRCAAFELFHRPDIPYRVVINEALNLAKEFGSDQSHKYVNAILDKITPRRN